MRERPILFSAPMVRAILAGRKTQTRRLVMPRPHDRHYLQPMWGVSPPPDPVEFGEKHLWREVGPDYPDGPEDDRRCPYGVPGDRLWVKETIRRVGSRGVFADGAPSVVSEWPWKRNVLTAIHCPRGASRITLEVAEIRVQRLQDISGEDAAAEGIAVPRCGCEVCSRSSAMCPADASAHIEEFFHLWDSINGARAPWSSDPWVWAVTFKELT